MIKELWLGSEWNLGDTTVKAKINSNLSHAISIRNKMSYGTYTFGLEATDLPGKPRFRFGLTLDLNLWIDKIIFNLSIRLVMSYGLQLLALALFNFVLKLWVSPDIVEQPLKNKESKACRHNQHNISLSQVVLSVFFEGDEVAFSVVCFREDEVNVIEGSQLIDDPCTFWISSKATSGEVGSEDAVSIHGLKEDKSNEPKDEHHYIFGGIVFQ